MPRSINVFNLLTVFAHIAGPLSRNNPGATTEGATARMIGHHLKHCQTPSKIINGLNLLRASKSPAEHVGRLDMARLHITRNISLHRFSWTGDTVTIKQVPMRPTKIIHLTGICKLQSQQGACTCWQPFGKLRFVQRFEDSSQTTLTCQFTFIASDFHRFLTQTTDTRSFPSSWFWSCWG